MMRPELERLMKALYLKSPAPIAARLLYLQRRRELAQRRALG